MAKVSEMYVRHRGTAQLLNRTGSLVLYIGITLAIFSLLGTMPVRKDLLNILANWFTIC